jgi:hypothetical protein
VLIEGVVKKQILHFVQEFFDCAEMRFVQDGKCWGGSWFPTLSGRDQKAGPSTSLRMTGWGTEFVLIDRSAKTKADLHSVQEIYHLKCVRSG